MASSKQREFEELMSDLYKLIPTLGLDDQPLLQKWIRCLSSWGKRGESDIETATAYAQYLCYQAQQSRLKFPFNAPPPEDDLPELKDLLYGRDEAGEHVVGDKFSSSLTTQVKQELKMKSSYPQDFYSYGRTTVEVNSASEDDDHNAYEYEDPGFVTAENFQSCDPIQRCHATNPLQVRVIQTELEDLPEEAPLWVLLSRLSPHTPDDGALLYAVVAEELAEWSARLAADQNMASRLAEVGDEEQWGPRADERADYWSEVWTAWRSLNEKDERAGLDLTTEILRWLNQGCHQLQAEHAQLQALLEELEEIQLQVKQSKIWWDAKFHAQNRAMQAEILGTEERIAESDKELKALMGKVNQITPKRTVTGSVPRKLSYSEDSPNTSPPE